MFDFLVIGKGLIGAAAARYLSAGDGRTAVLGPDEPADYAAHEGVFASHYDQGRITRQLSKDSVWSWLAQQAIARYAEITTQSGIDFHHPVGGLYVSPPGDQGNYVQQVGGLAQVQKIACEQLHGDVLQERFPYFTLPPGSKAIYEPPPAGYINPRELIRAQLIIAAQQGAAIMRETAVSITPAGDHLLVVSDAGTRIPARKVLLATGAFTNCHDLLPEKLPLRVKTETIILAEVEAAEPAPWGVQPTLIYQIVSADIADIYLLPPICYPDGRYYVKMGANTRADRDLADLADIRSWFIRGDSDQMMPALRSALQALLPGLSFHSWQTKRCAITYTPSGYPIIDAVLGDRLFVAAGGNGTSAKSSDTLGRLAAEKMHRPEISTTELAPFAFNFPG